MKFGNLDACWLLHHEGMELRTTRINNIAVLVVSFPLREVPTMNNIDTREKILSEYHLASFPLSFGTMEDTLSDFSPGPNLFS